MDVFNLVKSNNISELKKYLSYGDVNIVNSKRMSLLHYAILCNNINAFTLLIDNYIDVNIQDINGYTALHYAILNNRFGFTKTLIRHNANLELKNNLRESPLYKACALGREEIIALLLESIKIDFEECNAYNDTIFNAFIRSHNLKLVKKVPLTESLLNHKNIFSESPLHIALKINDLNITKYLLENKSFVNAKNNDLETPIFNAIRNNNIDAVLALIDYGAILDVKNRFNESIFDIGNPNLLEDLKLKPMFVKCNEYRNLYPLHYSIIVSDIDAIKRNLTRVNVKMKDSYGFYPIDLALKYDNSDLVKVIKEIK